MHRRPSPRPTHFRGKPGSIRNPALIIQICSSWDGYHTGIIQRLERIGIANYVPFISRRVKDYLCFEIPIGSAMDLA